MSFKQSKTIKAQIFDLLSQEQIRTPERRYYRENYIHVLAYFWYKQARRKIYPNPMVSAPPLEQFLRLLVSGSIENPETIRRCWQEVRAENPHFLEPKEAARRLEKARKTKEYYSML